MRTSKYPWIITLFAGILSLTVTLCIKSEETEKRDHGGVLLMDANPTDEEAGAGLPITTQKASSYLKDKNDPPVDINRLRGKYVPFQARDGKEETAWVEGVDGPGIGEWIQFFFRNPKYDSLINTNPYPKNSPAYYMQMHIIYRVLILNGCVINDSLFHANNRARLMELSFSEGEKRIIELKDNSRTYQIFKVGRIPSKWVRLKILDVYKGTKYDDTCISEVDFEEDNYGFFRAGGSYEKAKCIRCD